MAEGFARYIAGPAATIDSAGIEAHGLNARAVTVMKEIGIDISQQTSNQLDEFLLDNYDVLVTVCGDADERCPIVPAGVQKLHWPLPDPARLKGTDDEIMKGFRQVRDDIRLRVDSLF